MTHASTPSISDITINVTFSPISPITSTAVEVEGDELGHGDYLDLLAACITRLQVYRAGYLEGLCEDGAMAQVSHTH